MLHRTLCSENAVRNRWNSVEFKQRKKYHVDADTVSGSESGYASPAGSDPLLPGPSSRSPSPSVLPEHPQRPDCNPNATSASGGSSSSTISRAPLTSGGETQGEESLPASRLMHRVSTFSSHPTFSPISIDRKNMDSRAPGVGGSSDSGKGNSRTCFGSRYKGRDKTILFSAEDMALIRAANEFLCCHIYSPRRSNCHDSDSDGMTWGKDSISRDPSRAVVLSPLLASLLSPARKATTGCSVDASNHSACVLPAGTLPSTPTKKHMVSSENETLPSPDFRHTAPTNGEHDEIATMHGRVDCFKSSITCGQRRCKGESSPSLCSSEDTRRGSTDGRWSDVLAVSDEEFYMHDSDILVSPVTGSQELRTQDGEALNEIHHEGRQHDMDSPYRDIVRPHSSESISLGPLSLSPRLTPTTSQVLSPKVLGGVEMALDPCDTLAVEELMKFEETFRETLKEEEIFLAFYVSHCRDT